MSRLARPASLGLLLALAAVLAAALEVPFLAGRVNDLAGMIPADAEGRIEARLERLETEHGAQVVVLTIPSLEGEVLEDYSLRVAETWQLGRAEFDDGALLLIARDDRKMRLEVGYGLEPSVTDLASRRILDDVVRPRFRRGDFAGGIEEAVEVIAGLVEGEDALPPPGGGSGQTTPSGRIGGAFGFLLAVGFFSLMAIASSGCIGWFLFAVLTPFWFVVPLTAWGAPLGLIPGVVWVIAFPFLWRRFSRLAARGRSRGGGRWSSSSGWGGFSGGSSGGGFSGGGFSGGGGSFGGGGSSGGW